MVDNHREDLKEFRIGVLFFKVVSLFRDICALFQSSSELILHLKISPTRASYERRKKEYRAQLTERTVIVKESIGRMEDWLTQNEFQIVQDKWGVTINRIDKILMRLPKLVNQPQTKLDYNYDTESEEDGGFTLYPRWSLSSIYASFFEISSPSQDLIAHLEYYVSLCYSKVPPCSSCSRKFSVKKR
ncbi:hypothetical protein PSTT_05604 [Puccinia striiformis]|uniref:Uncharacterized protein n=1 Tax=Puccinia striiformis TaxID=27350 RepID=A0A2S4VNJ3_9BASI|nr:hypothetical protein PSTT_05604 [Puccinia striiformis]